MYMNNVDNVLHCKISEFPDDTELGSKFTTEIECLQFQMYLAKVIGWVHMWKIYFCQFVQSFTYL